MTVTIVLQVGSEREGAAAATLQRAVRGRSGSDSAAAPAALARHDSLREHEVRHNRARERALIMFLALQERYVAVT